MARGYVKWLDDLKTLFAVRSLDDRVLGTFDGAEVGKVLPVSELLGGTEVEIVEPNGAEEGDAARGLKVPDEATRASARDRVRRATSGYDIRAWAERGDALVVVLGDPNTAPTFGTPAVLEKVPVDAYLLKGNVRDARPLLAALEELVEMLGYETPQETLLRFGSVCRRAVARLRHGLASEELRERLAKAERALEVRVLDAQQAEVDLKYAEVIQKVMDGLRDQLAACIQVGSLLIVKYPDAQGQVLLVRNLSEPELQALRRFPEIQKNPFRVIEALGNAVAGFELSSTDDGPASGL